MASFPNSVKNFISRIAHTDKVEASHINDLQDEVNAIETTLLSGTEGQVLTSGSSGVPNWAENTGGGFPKVTATQDWSSASSVATDIYLSMGISASQIDTENSDFVFKMLSFSSEQFTKVDIILGNGNAIGAHFANDWTNGSPLSGYAIVYNSYMYQVPG